MRKLLGVPLALRCIQITSFRASMSNQFASTEAAVVWKGALCASLPYPTWQAIGVPLLHLHNERRTSGAHLCWLQRCFWETKMSGCIQNAPWTTTVLCTVYFSVVGKTASICNFWVHPSTRVFLRLLSGAISVLVTWHELFFLDTLDCSLEPLNTAFLSSEHFCKSPFLVLSYKPILVVHRCNVFQFVCPLWMVSYISSVIVWEMVIQEAAYTGNERFALQLMHCQLYREGTILAAPLSIS